jgi:RNA polymerase sigma factor (sigma-70 family)
MTELKADRAPGPPEEGAPGDEDLLALWQVARGEAMRSCARTLARLRAGEGGFYEAEDFLQDLFLAFWSLVQAWHATAPRDAGALWAAWRQALCRGGAHILRRAPMRLWERRERPVAPQCLALEDDPAERAGEGQDSAPLDAAAVRALTQPEDAEAAHLSQVALEELEEGLWGLRPGQRQVIYMAALAGLPEKEVARRLGLPSGNTVAQRLFLARAALRRRLGG